MKILIRLSFILMLISCNSKDKGRYEMYVFTEHNIAGVVQCDSFQMVSSKEAYIWNNGTKMRVVGNIIKPNSR